MLTVAKLTQGQEQYYERSVAQGLDDYYAGRGESPGVWTGRGSPGLGLVPRRAARLLQGPEAAWPGCSSSQS